MKTPLPSYSPGINVAVIRQVNQNWQYLLLQRSGEDPAYGGVWGLLSGTRDNHETVTALALREMQEEIGLRPNLLFATEYCLQFFVPTRDAVWVLPVLAATVDSDAKIVLNSENSDYRWLECREAVNLAHWRNLKDVIRLLEEDLAGFPPPNWMAMPVP
jgi:8-oxo-dGTP pyrophosphatase MutT (NUDIX family)